jgi:hypothetical protein
MQSLINGPSAVKVTVAVPLVLHGCRCGDIAFCRPCADRHAEALGRTIAAPGLPAARPTRQPLIPPSHASGPATRAWEAVQQGREDARSLAALRDAEHALADTWDELAFGENLAPTMAARDWWSAWSVRDAREPVAEPVGVDTVDLLAWIDRLVLAAERRGFEWRDLDVPTGLPESAAEGLVEVWCDGRGQRERDEEEVAAERPPVWEW